MFWCMDLGVDDGGRTRDLLTHNQALLPTELRPHPNPRLSAFESLMCLGVTDGIRTHDSRDHNPMLYR